jgi:hypothetical protein
MKEYSLYRIAGGSLLVRQHIRLSHLCIELVYVMGIKQGSFAPTDILVACSQTFLNEQPKSVCP